MAEFDDLREQLQRARDERDAANTAQVKTRELLRRIAERERELDRVFNSDNEDHRAQREQLRAERERAQDQLARDRTTFAGAGTREAEVLIDFSQFTDPRRAITQFNDNTPILLMPVRLETRFKSFINPDTGGQTSQLWVRVYPDDCWIDSFEPTLTETEVTNARGYWTGVWKAGGIEDQERGAWSVLVNGHGAGRAAWIVSQFKPANAGSKPAKPRPEDIILVIATDTPLAPAEETAASVFWRSVWLADGDSEQIKAAQAALEQQVGAERASEIISNYQPANFADVPQGGLSKAAVNVGVATLIFDPIETKQVAWSHAPQLKTPPDRFVFIGYQGGNATVVQVGNPVPSRLFVGPDPTAPKEDQLHVDDAGNLVVPEELKWITDFDQAVAVGMGFRIDLDATQARGGFDRVLVVGLRSSESAETGKAVLESLIKNHSFSRKGFALVTQGTPTNNTEETSAGFDRQDDVDQSFKDQKAPLFVPDVDWLNKRDGQWLAEYLGINPAVLENTHNSDATDQRCGRAMNIALWPATMGYWMESMMAGVFSRNAIDQTREFFNYFVIGAGTVPAIRIGEQPYGILPATKFSQMRWLEQPVQTDTPGTIFLPPIIQDPLRNYLRRLYPILLSIATDWRAMLTDVSFVGKSDDPHKVLLDIIGLHPGSVEWSQRYAESLRTVFNRLNLDGLGGFFAALALAAQRAASQQLLQRFGVPENVKPLILDKIFSGSHFVLKGGVVDDQPLSDTEQIRPYTETDQNYIQWLIDAANTSLDALYRQDGFKDDKLPTALLYLLLRHALQLGYDDVGIRLRVDTGIFTAEAAQKARIDQEFLHIRENAQLSESRYQPLYEVVPAITGSQTQLLHQFIASQLSSLTFTSFLRDQLAALERLKSEPTARLERAFSDHVDCCSYRLDSWLLGIVNYQLSLMRNVRHRGASRAREGIYLGGFAWLENLRPENKVLTPVTLEDPQLSRDFASPDQTPLMRDPTNQGFVHAPSLNHGVAAAVLRNGFISNASEQNRQTMSVNLTSERVRTALALLEGIRSGQGLADLLGYQFERGLHDRHNLAEVDKFILDLRRAFPLRGDHLLSTKPPEGVSIESIEARNVMDGLALVEQIKATGNNTYPFGRNDLPPIQNQIEADAINLEVDRLLEAHDAVADLTLAEGVYQAVLGNYDRVAANYDASARGNFPPEPDIVRTSFQGIGLTHRVALHLEAGANPNVSPTSGLGMTPRAQAEPALNNWLSSILPPLGDVSCVVTFRRADTGAQTSRGVTLRDLELQPADLVLLVPDRNEQAMAELDDRIVRHVMQTFGARPDEPVAISYLQKTTSFSVFELLPLTRHVRRLVTRSRALRATDLTLSNEAKTAQDLQPFVDPQRLLIVRTAMENLRADLATFQTRLERPLSDLENRRDEILSDVDQYVDDVVDRLSRAATFSVAQAGWGFAYDFRRPVFAAILKQADDLVTRWDKKIAEFNGAMDDELALPNGASVDEHLLLLTTAERAISTVTANPAQTDPDAYRNDLLTVKLPPFQAKHNDFRNLKDTTLLKPSDLLDEVKTFLPVTDFDAVEFSVAGHEKEMILLTEDALAVTTAVITELDRRLSESQDLFDKHADAVDAANAVKLLEDAAKVLLGPDFRIFPEFSLSSSQGDELENALALSRSRELFDHLINPEDPNMLADDFCVDTWLYGVARVREKMHSWEQTVMFAGSLGRPEPQLDAIQLPFIPGDRWLGLEFPKAQKLDRDRLLYTAHFAVDFNKTARQCGMLLDEWTETIPLPDVDTGITFHHDRPNCEAPQTMLLVTPTEFRGSWQWDDLVDALNETLDLAKLRAIEPSFIDRTAYAPFLPATIMASQVAQLTIAANLALNNKVEQVMEP